MARFKTWSTLATVGGLENSNKVFAEFVFLRKQFVMQMFQKATPFDMYENLFSVIKQASFLELKRKFDTP